MKVYFLLAAYVPENKTNVRAIFFYSVCISLIYEPQKIYPDRVHGRHWYVDPQS